MKTFLVLGFVASGFAAIIAGASISRGAFLSRGDVVMIILTTVMSGRIGEGVRLGKGLLSAQIIRNIIT